MLPTFPLSESIEMDTSPDISNPAFWKAEPSACPVCGATTRKVLGRRGGDAHRAGLGTPAQIVRCRECHLVYPYPSLKPLGNPYAAYEGEEYFATHQLDAKMENGRQLIAKAEQLLGRKGRLLELGCGRGELLGMAAEGGWTVAGVEMTPQFAAAAAARGIQIEESSVEESALLDRLAAFDVIYLAAILEHLYDPVACLRRIKKALTPGGLVFIDVPNECSFRTKLGNLYMRVRGRDWVTNLSPTFPPFHVVGFCPGSLARALAAAGLEIAELSVVRWPDALPARSGFWGAVEAGASKAVNRVAGFWGDGDGIVCWARNADAGPRS